MVHFQLPNETWDTIIDFLHSDHPSLVVCSLVCRSWLPTSRYHLFERIVLRSQHNQQKFLRSTTGMTLQNCTFGGYTHRLEMYGNCAKSPWVPDRTTLFTWDLCEAIVSRLPLFSAVTSLHLSGINWDQMHDIVVPSVMSIFRNITELDLTDMLWEDPVCLIQFLVAFPMLEGLRICAGGLTTDDSPERVACYKLGTRLRRLVLKAILIESRVANFGYLFKWLSMQRPPLDYLEIDMSFHSPMVFSGGLADCSGFIRNLRDVRHFVVAPPQMERSITPSQPILDLSHWANLRVLHYRQYPSDVLYPWQHHLQQSISKIQQLQELRIQLSFGLYDSTSLIAVFHWEELDSVLSNMRNLNAVQFALKGIESETADLKGEKRLLSYKLPRCTSRGILSVTEVVDDYGAQTSLIDELLYLRMLASV
ncbi:hypothetical protein F5146DRAFT_1052493 [Armillaria mellea]|nr:hypothetical protein F5146DRAFT_1052493 [Armillaria mellea]